MIALGIDPGSAICGFAFVQALNAQISPLHFGVITTSPKAPFPDRLLKIHSELDSLINSFHPDVLGIEKLFFGRNSTTALPVAHARGVVLLAAAAHNLPILEFAPNEVKLSITGYGRANKHQVTFMVQKLFNLKSPPHPDDAADALAIAVAAAYEADSPARRNFFGV